MRDDDPVMAALAAADPHPGGADPVGGEPELARLRDQIMATPAPRLGRRRRPRVTAGPLLAVSSVIAVIAVVVLFLHVGSSARRGSAASPSAGTTRIVLRVEPSPAGPHVTAAAVREEVAFLRVRARSLGAVGITVRRVGAVEIAVTVPLPGRVGFITRYLTATPQLAFTDWEANVIAPNGHTVASENLHRDAARFFVLRDDVALLGAQLTDAHAATSNGQSVIDVTFTRRGAAALQALTATVARRGERLTLGASPEYQHFAVILDGSLLSVPSLNYHSYPDGLSSANRTGEILGDFTPAAATRIATELRLGLALNLRVVSHS
jgi:preprotein translocase subunit SecD